MSYDYKEILENKKAEANQLMNNSQLTKCNIAIHTAAGASGASGLNPLPMADAIPISAAQITMVIALGKIFEQKITESAAKAIIGAAASTFVGRNLVKLIPVAGWVVSAAVAAGVTEAMGWTIAVDFAKKAKLEWNALHHMDDVSVSSPKTSETEKEHEKIQAIINSLNDRAQPFITGEKTKQDAGDEFNKLVNDFEQVLDSLDLNHPLRDVYLKLFGL